MTENHYVDVGVDADVGGPRDGDAVEGLELLEGDGRQDQEGED